MIKAAEAFEAFKTLDFNVCMQCGTCAGSCPISMKSKLNPRKLMLETAYLFHSLTIYPPLNMKQKSEVWDCTTCSNCSSRCPREAKPLDVIISLRGYLLEQGLVPQNIANVLEAVLKYGNPWGISRSKRSEWAKDLKIEYASEKKEANTLYFVGCAASYDTRVQNVSKAIAKTLNLLNVSFSILGNEENCCGNEVYSLGEKGLFEELAKINLELFEHYHVQEIITTSPHCFNAFKVRYGKKLDATHYTSYFADLIDRGKFRFSKKVEKIVTYHDPCFLGKHHNIYDDPRKIIENIPGVKFVEMDRSRKRSVCCEGGGGRMWYDIPDTRLSEKRVKEALSLGVEVIATACPFCMLTLEDSIKTIGVEDKIQVKDIMELLAEAL
jgi:Fe-S oxidoreductase